ncbi:MAG: hypothetical protein R6V13_08415 [Anaerolineae bacterium]
MKYRLSVLLFATIALVLSYISVGAIAGENPNASPNLLTNPGFEDEFTPREDPYTGVLANELGVAEGWEPWYDNSQGCPAYDPRCEDPDWYNVRPEYKAEEATLRVRSGDKAQKFFTTYGTHTAGFYQMVEVPADSWVRFSVWTQVWSSNKDLPEHSFLPGYYRLSVGIDPMGGTDWQSEDILWSEPTVRHDGWVQLQIEAYAEAKEISVWTRGAPIWAVKHNDSYWDDAELIVLEGTPRPTPTPSPTNTPYPTPQSTPADHTPDLCWGWDTIWKDGFEGSELTDWGQDAAEGSIDMEGGALWLRNGSSPYKAFPLAWSEGPWPAEDELRLSFRFAYGNVTAYGSTIGVGSAPYDGQRTLAGAEGVERFEEILRSRYHANGGDVELTPEDVQCTIDKRIEGTEDILRIHHREGDYSIQLLGDTVWKGTPGDETWHDLSLEIAGTTYTVSVDGVKVGKGASHWRPHSLHLGNPMIAWSRGRWTEVAIDDVRLERCKTKTPPRLPLITRG